jgi:hypothetical protein
MKLARLSSTYSFNDNLNYIKDALMGHETYSVYWINRLVTIKR